MLRLSGLSKTYADGTEALRDISLQVGKGDILALVGGSGCGKTTLLRLIAGLDIPSSGAITVNGETIKGPHPSIGIVFQEPRLLPWLTVAGNVGFGLAGLPRPHAGFCAHRKSKNRVFTTVNGPAGKPYI
jgi:sulfonate transport system ATP-binding protein